MTVADEPSASAIEVTADGGSLEVIEGTGGVHSLDDDNKADIQQTLDDEILRKQPVTFRSSKVTPAGGGWRAEGELTLLGATRPFAFDVRLGDDGSIGAERGAQADPLGAQALLDAVRRAQGRRRGHDPRRRRPPGLTRVSRSQSRVHRLRVEPALHAGRELHRCRARTWRCRRSSRSSPGRLRRR